MPIYEFDCPACGQAFEELVRSAEAVKNVNCPLCGSHQVRRKLSLFASKMSGSGASVAQQNAPACAPAGT